MVDDFHADASENIYWQYVQQCCPHFNLNVLSQLKEDIQTTNWEEPSSAIEFNNVAVMALVAADNAEDLSERLIYWEFALDLLNQGAELPNNFLCKAHLAVAYSLINNLKDSTNIADNCFLETLQALSIPASRQPLGLVYLPRHLKKWSIICSEQLPVILQASDGVTQALTLSTEVLCHSHLFFLNKQGLKLLQLAVQFNTNSAMLNLQLGLCGICHEHMENLAYIYRARILSLDSSIILQSLYLVCQHLQQMLIAEQWKAIATTYAQNNPQDIQWKWTELDVDSPFTYVPFEDTLLLAVESSLHSIVTNVLIAQGDWFEVEMELWRDNIYAGMTIIDVGANVGVYTYSAAQRVGKLGKVIAIEPFSGCVRCLEETRRVNQLDWVRIIAGAVGEHNGKARLSLKSSNEANKLISEDDEVTPTDIFETVAYFTLDSLIEQENLNRVDWLKIDAEGHEMQVLAGSNRILQEFKPNILYENIEGKQENSIEVAEYLMQHDYKLFYYRPYLKQLILVDLLEELQGNLNIIAISNSKFHN
ncbi:MAG: FkbM family methyltransferase [Pseudanabaena frigida]|uniref:FkbM family methyltransferase n=1 Tax=Pseudanabaena frigida TaxID=945775 RepID=A0A2W4XVJ4_9CYAN|nr:MAG: FkbM family methyltransferase [Pseudanabaena frigida]